MLALTRPTSRPLATSRRAGPGATLWAAGGLALGLHLAAGWSASIWLPTSARQPPPARMMAVRLLTAAPLAATATAPETTVSAETVAPTTPLPPVTPSRPVAAPAADTPEARDTVEPGVVPAPAAAMLAWPTDGSPEFLSSDEVDEPARPRTAWLLDAEALALLGITRIVFDAWIDAASTVVKLRVVHMEPPITERLAPLVEARLAATAMVAAQQQGRPVAHVQRVELGWEHVKGTAG